MRKALVATAVLVAAVAVLIGLSLPPRRQALSAPSSDSTVPGILHVHSSRSDGRGSPDDIARAAARAGLRFVVITDHGDATRVPDPPTYRSGVLCLDGVEISTTGGHYIAVDMPASPYPLGGEARDVVADVKRLGGFGIVAHPDSPKPDLRWREWSAPFDAIELVNPDTSWRQWMAAPEWRNRLRLLSALLAYPFRPSEAIASLIQPTGALYQWEALARRRRVVTLAGADAHANLALRNTDPTDRRFALALPGYEASFRTLSVRVQPDRPLTGNAAADAAVISRALRAGHSYTAIDAAASPPSLEFTATDALGTVHDGDELGVAGPVSLHVRSNAPRGFTTTIWNGTKAIAADRREPEFTVEVPEGDGVYWAEIRAADRTPVLTWVRSNPIYVRTLSEMAPGPAAQRPPATQSQPISASAWRVERDPSSVAAIDLVPAVGDLRFRFGLAGGSSPDPYAALVVDTPQGIASSDRVTFTARAEHPMRLSVQLRTPAARWQRSVYVDTFAEPRTVYFDDLTPLGATDTWKPPLDQVRSILLVVERTNTKPGTSGRIWIGSPALQR